MFHLIDSNAIIDYLAAKLPAASMAKMHSIVNESLFISVITQIETLGFQSGNAAEDINTCNFISLATVLHLTPNIVQQTILLRKLYKIKVPDAIIAATAIVNNFALISHNLSDFNSIAGLHLIDSYTFESCSKTL